MKQAIILATWSHKKRHEHWAAGYQNVCDPDRAVPRHWPARPLDLHLKSPLLRPILLLFCPSRFQNVPLWLFWTDIFNTCMPPQRHSSVLSMIMLQYHCPEGNIKVKTVGEHINRMLINRLHEYIKKTFRKKEIIISDYTDKHGKWYWTWGKNKS